MKRELRIFLSALMFYTRIPVPKGIDHSQEYLQKATRYFPLIGILVGSISAGVWYAAQFVLPLSVSVVLSMLAGILVTGAFHEDGLADVCDGFGGGWTKEKILHIMKDSSIGAYGAIGLILLFLIKYSLLIAINPLLVPCVIIAAHALSRFVAITFLYTHAYARAEVEGQADKSKIRAVAGAHAVSDLVWAGVFGMAPLLLFHNPWVVLLPIPLFALKGYLGWYFRKWIGGYTGDCMGATQQCTEVLFYLCFIILWKYT